MTVDQRINLGKFSWQLDGQIDQFSDNDDDIEIGHFGHLNCDENNMFTALTMLRGLENYLGSFCMHDMCKHTNHSNQNGPCGLCLLRSFIYRINNIKPKAHKSVTPTEMYPLMNILEGKSVFGILDYFMKTMIQKSSNESAKSMLCCSQCHKEIDLPHYISTLLGGKHNTPMPTLLKQVLRTHINCNCAAEFLEIKLSNPVILVVQFEQLVKLSSLRQSFEIRGSKASCLSIMTCDNNDSVIYKHL